MFLKSPIGKKYGGKMIATISLFDLKVFMGIMTQTVVFYGYWDTASVSLLLRCFHCLFHRAVVGALMIRMMLFQLLLHRLYSIKVLLSSQGGKVTGSRCGIEQAAANRAETSMLGV